MDRLPDPEDRRNYPLLYLRGDLERLPEPEEEILLSDDASTEAPTDDTPLCPALVGAVMRAQNVSEVCRLMDEHDLSCVLCNPARKKAA
jgi:hypothetical protein